MTTLCDMDVVFLSNNEPYVDHHKESLLRHLEQCTNWKGEFHHVNGIRGINKAHQECANIVKSSNFFVVDSDAIIIDPTWDFTISFEPRSDTVYVWRAVNSANYLTYGYGAIKLFPKVLQSSNDQYVDFTSQATAHYKVMDRVINLTVVNHDEFDAWVSGYREAFKLTRENSPVSIKRLEVWKNNTFKTPHVEYSRLGAFCGWMDCLNGIEPHRINDWEWLTIRYQSELVK